MKILAKYPPPHVTDPYFYGLNADADETIILMENSLKELVASMENAGLPAEDIDAAVQMYEHGINKINTRFDDSTEESSESAGSPEDQAADPKSKKQHLTAEGAGHYGIFSGRRWREQIAPKIRDFIRANV